jgi:hypothetical protein
MAGQLIPPAGLEPTMPSGLTVQQRISLWADLVDATEELVKMGLRNKLGPNGDVDQAFREWYERQCAEHDRVVIHMMQEIRRKQMKNAG